MSVASELAVLAGFSLGAVVFYAMVYAALSAASRRWSTSPRADRREDARC